MSFWDALGQIASTIIEKGAQAQADAQKRINSQLKDYEKKIANCYAS